MHVCLSGYHTNFANLSRGHSERLGRGERICGCWIDGTDPPDEFRCSQVISCQHHRSTDTYPWRPLQPQREGGHARHSGAAAQQGTYSTNCTGDVMVCLLAAPLATVCCSIHEVNVIQINDLGPDLKKNLRKILTLA